MALIKKSKLNPGLSPAAGHRTVAGRSAQLLVTASRTAPAGAFPTAPGTRFPSASRRRRRNGERPDGSFGGGRGIAPLDGADCRRRGGGRRRVAGATRGHQADSRQPRAARGEADASRRRTENVQVVLAETAAQIGTSVRAIERNAQRQGARSRSSPSSSGARRISARSRKRSAASPTRPICWR